jgi:hypothetical protein
MHRTIPVNMTIVCIDIVKTFSFESRESNGRTSFRRAMVASGLDRALSNS